MYTGFWWGGPRERYHVQDLGVDGKIILRWILWKWNDDAWAGLVWLSIVTDDEYLLMW